MFGGWGGMPYLYTEIQPLVLSSACARLYEGYKSITKWDA